jgi:exodeoxyribonuclease X
MSMIIRVCDFEATGLWEDDAPPPALCEVGWCDVVDRGGGNAEVMEGSRHSLLVDPGRPMPPEAQAVHHISDAMLRGTPPIERGLLLLRGGATDEHRPLVFAAHSAGYEMRFFNPPGSRWIDTHKVALRLFPHAPRHTNQVLRYWLGLKMDEDAAMPPHRAGPDAYVTAHVLAAMLRVAGAVNGKGVDEFVAWSESFALYPKVPFGKHYGQAWDSVPASYLEWMCDQRDMDAEYVANARYHLRRRASGHG